MKLLFLCVANSARSQIAEGLAKQMLNSNVEIQSAGSEPSGKVHPGAVSIMENCGIDISTQTSKSVDDLPPDFIKNVDCVITLCTDEVCPAILSPVKKIHWPVPDPAAFKGDEQVTAFTHARDFIKEKIESEFNEFLR